MASTNAGVIRHCASPLLPQGLAALSLQKHASPSPFSSFAVQSRAIHVRETEKTKRTAVTSKRSCSHHPSPSPPSSERTVMRVTDTRTEHNRTVAKVTSDNTPSHARTHAHKMTHTHLSHRHTPAVIQSSIQSRTDTLYL